MRKKEEEVKKKEALLREREEELNKREKDLAEKEKQLEEMERAVQEMLSLKKYSGSSTNAGTDIANDSVCILKGVTGNKSESDNNDPNYFTSSHNGELVG